MNDRFKEIVDAELEKWQQPEEKMTIRGLLLRVAERVEEQMQEQAGREPCLRCAHVDQFIETIQRSNRELADENRNLRDQLQVADEQCHQQVADAVKAREEALAELKAKRQDVEKLMWLLLCEGYTLTRILAQLEDWK